LEISKVEPARYGELVQLISSILTETEAHNAARFTEEVWRWRYVDLPSHDARIYGVFDSDRLAGYYHAPIFDARIGGEPKRFAMVQDVAVDSSLRGQGVFRRLAEFATADLAASDVDLIYTFPNDRSIHTFEKYNEYDKVAPLSTHILPINSKKLIARRVNLWGFEKFGAAAVDATARAFALSPAGGQVITRQRLFSGRVGELFSDYAKSRNFAINRDADYLNWRFGLKPGPEHFVYSCDSPSGEMLAAAVFKLDTLFDAHGLLLMDFAHTPGNENALSALISQVAHGSQAFVGAEVDFVFASGLADFLPSLKRIGFLPVPLRANPRPLNLLARSAASHPGPALFEGENWHVTLADWDVF